MLVSIRRHPLLLMASWLLLLLLVAPLVKAQNATTSSGICWMQYSMADNDLYRFLIADINEVQSSRFIRDPKATTWIYVDGNAPRIIKTQREINNVLLPDGSPAPGGEANTAVRYLSWDHGLGALVLKEQLPEANSDDPQALIGFLTTALADCIARGATEFMLIMSSHGSGFGFGHDEDKGRRRRRRLTQSNDDIAAAIQTALATTTPTIPKLDVLAFDACLQASLSALEDFRNATRYYMASEAVEPGTGYNYSAWVPQPTALAAAEANIDSFVSTPSYRTFDGTWHHQAPKTLGVFDLERLPEFYERWEALSEELLNLLTPQNDTTFFATLTRSRAATTGFRGSYDRASGEANEVFSFMDIGHFLQVFGQRCAPATGTPLQSLLNETQAAYRELVHKFGKGPLTPQPVTGVTVGWVSRKRFLKNPVYYSTKLFAEKSITRTAETPLFDEFLESYLSYDKRQDVEATGFSVCGCPVSAAAAPSSPDTLMWNQSVALVGGDNDDKEVRIGGIVAPTVDDVGIEFGLDITPIFTGEATLDDDDETLVLDDDAEVSRNLMQLGVRRNYHKLLEGLRKRRLGDASNTNRQPPSRSANNSPNNNRRHCSKGKRSARKSARRQRRQRRRLQEEEEDDDDDVFFVQGDYTEDYVLMFGGFLYPEFDCDRFTTSWDQNFYAVANSETDEFEDFLYVYRGSSGENTLEVYYFPESLVDEALVADLEARMEAFQLSYQEVEEMGGLYSELIFDDQQLREWDDRIPLDILALYTLDANGTAYSQTAPSEGGILLPIVYLEAELGGVIALDYLIGGWAGSTIPWSENAGLHVGPVGAESVASTLGLKHTVIDLLAVEYPSETEAPKIQYDYYLLVHGEDGAVVGVENEGGNTTTIDPEGDDSGEPSRETPTGNGTEAQVEAPGVAEEQGTPAPTENRTCGDDICTEEEYCWNETRWGWKYDEYNTTQCIPKTYSCGGQQCENFPVWVCNLDRGVCMSITDVCEGVRGEAENCADTTAWKRWTVPKDGIATKKTRDICEYEPIVCGDEEAVDVAAENKSSGNTLAVFASSLVVWFGFFVAWWC